MTITYENGSKDHSSNGMNGRMLLTATVALLAFLGWFAICAITGESTVHKERRGRSIVDSSTDAVRAQLPAATQMPRPQP